MAHLKNPMDCICNGWCDCHKAKRQGRQQNDPCDCRKRTAEEKQAEQAENDRMCRIFGITPEVR